MTQQTTAHSDDQTLALDDLDQVVAAAGLTKVGAGQLTLAATNTYTGVTQVQGDIIAI
jgi:autotransporter-associated beta strand protein